MKTMAIDARRALPPRVLKAAEREPVLTVRGSSRFLIHSLSAKTTPRANKSTEKSDTSEERDWVEFVSSRLLSAYADEDAIYNEPNAR